MMLNRILGLFLLLSVIHAVAVPSGFGHKIEKQHHHINLDPKFKPKSMEQQKYPDTAGIDIVTDAPWRVDRRLVTNAWIPLLIFVPDVNLDNPLFSRNRFLGIIFKRITIMSLHGQCHM